MTKAVKAIISGRVQGVWYRGWTQETARRLGLDGWVQNRRDGTVQAVFSGPEDKVDEMLKLCEEGPEYAFVTSVEHIPHLTEVQPGFHIRRSV